MAEQNYQLTAELSGMRMGADRAEEIANELRALPGVVIGSVKVTPITKLERSRLVESGTPREPTSLEWAAAREYKSQVEHLQPELTARQVYIVQTTFLSRLMRFNDENGERRDGK